MVSVVRLKGVVLLAVLSLCSLCPTAVDADCDGEGAAGKQIVVSGACEGSSYLNSAFTLEGKTADGKEYFVNGGGHYYLYYDSDCRGDQSSPARWFFAPIKPSTTATKDLAGDGEPCFGSGYLPSTSANPPANARWRINCDVGDVNDDIGWIDVEITISAPTCICKLGYSGTDCNSSNVNSTTTTTRTAPANATCTATAQPQKIPDLKCDSPGSCFEAAKLLNTLKGVRVMCGNTNYGEGLGSFSRNNINYGSKTDERYPADADCASSARALNKLDGVSNVGCRSTQQECGWDNMNWCTSSNLASLNNILHPCLHGVKDNNGSGCSSCNPGWCGRLCDDCDDSHFGKDCAKLVATCEHGTKPSFGIKGTGHCSSCHVNWAGDDCDDCDGTHFGTDCSRPVSCNTEHSTSSNSGVKGDGHCSSCKVGWTGVDCGGTTTTTTTATTTTTTITTTTITTTTITTTFTRTSSTTTATISSTTRTSTTTTIIPLNFVCDPENDHCGKNRRCTTNLNGYHCMYTTTTITATTTTATTTTATATTTTTTPTTTTPTITTTATDTTATTVTVTATTTTFVAIDSRPEAPKHTQHLALIVAASSACGVSLVAVLIWYLSCRKGKSKKYNRLQGDIELSGQANRNGATLDSEDDDLMEITSTQLNETSTYNLASQSGQASVATSNGSTLSNHASKYQFVRLLGRGSFGDVVLVQDSSTGQKLAKKILRGATLADANGNLAEMRKMLQIQHPNTVQCLDCFLDVDQYSAFQVNIVMEYCDGDLQQHIGAATKPFPQDVLLRVLSMLASALAHIHELGMIHRDVKPANIMTVGKELVTATLKLGDFGLSTNTLVGSSHKSIAGTPAFMAHEVWAELNYDSAVDIWALGVTLIYMASLRKLPLRVIATEEDAVKLRSLVPEGQYDDVITFTTNAMTQMEPSARPKAAKLACDFDQSASNGTHFNTACHGSMASMVNPQSMPWAQMVERLVAGWTPVPGSSHVKFSSFETSSDAAAAGTQLLEFACRGGVRAPNANLLAHIEVLGSRFVRSSIRGAQFFGKTQDFLQNYSGLTTSTNWHPFRLPGNGTGDALDATCHDAAEIEWRRMVLARFDVQIPNLLGDISPGMLAGRVKTILAFHVPPSVEVADAILCGNFAVLASLDAGYFGQGIYFTTDARYALEAYAAAEGPIPLMVCMLAVGNTYPVIESAPVELSATAPGTYRDQLASEMAAEYLERTKTHKGCALVAKADSHVAFVAKAQMPVGEADDVYLPAPPSKWAALDAAGTLYTEIVVRDGSQVLPLGYVVVQPL